MRVYIQQTWPLGTHVRAEYCFRKSPLFTRGHHIVDMSDFYTTYPTTTLKLETFWFILKHVNHCTGKLLALKGKTPNVPSNKFVCDLEFNLTFTEVLNHLCVLRCCFYQTWLTNVSYCYFGKVIVLCEESEGLIAKLSVTLGNAVTVNGMPVSLPKSYSGSGLTLEKVGLFVSLSSRLGVTLLWDGGKTHTYKLNIKDPLQKIHRKTLKYLKWHAFAPLK